MDYSSFPFPVVFDFSQTFETFNWKIIDLFSSFDHKEKISASLQSHIGNRELPNGGVLRRKQCKFFVSIFSFIKANFKLFACLLRLPPNKKLPSTDLGTSMSYNCRHILDIVLLHQQHISILSLAITYSNRALFSDSKAFNDKPEPDFGAGQP